jgi:hypothetical protein
MSTSIRLHVAWWAIVTQLDSIRPCAWHSAQSAKAGLTGMLAGRDVSEPLTGQSFGLSLIWPVDVNKVVQPDSLGQLSTLDQGAGRRYLRELGRWYRITYV